MTCKQVQLKLSSYVDRELPGGEMLHMRAHIMYCPCCMAEEQEIRCLKQALCNCRSVEPTPDFEARLLARIGQEREVRRSGSAWYLPVAMSLAAAAALLAIMASAPQDGTRSKPSVATEIRTDQSVFDSANPLSGGHMVLSAGYDKR